MDIADDMFEAEPYDNALAMVVKQASLSTMRSQNMLKLQDRFATEIIRTLWFADSGQTHEIDVIVFQLGRIPIEIRNIEGDVYKVKAELPGFIKVKTKQWDLEGAIKEENLLKDMGKLGLAAVGKSNVYKDHKLLPRDKVFQTPFKK